MAKLDQSEEALLAAMLAEMAEQGLPVQQGGFEVDVIPTGISSFDLSTGVGGVPRRRLSLFTGAEASGKTLLLLTLIANIQRNGGRAAFVDAEHALTPDFARLLGVNYDDLVISRPNTLEQCYDVYKKWVRSGLFDVVGFDSAVALAPESELELSAADSVQRAGQAQVHSQELKKLIALCHNRTAMVFINQVRTDPNPPAYWTGPPKTYNPGGAALNFYASLRVVLKSAQTYKGPGGIRIGHQIKTYITKNKVGAPYQRAEFDIRYTEGLDNVTNLIDTALSLGVLVKKSSWFYFTMADEEGEVTEEFKWAGRAKMDDAIRDNTELRDAIAAELMFDEEATEKNSTGWDDV